MGVHVFLHVCNSSAERAAAGSNTTCINSSGSCPPARASRGKSSRQSCRAHKPGLSLRSPDYLGETGRLELSPYDARLVYPRRLPLRRPRLSAYCRYGQIARCMEREDPETVKVAGLGPWPPSPLMTPAVQRDPARRRLQLQTGLWR